MVALASQNGYKNIVVPEADAREAALVEGVNILPFATLSQLVRYLLGEIPVPEVDKAKLRGKSCRL